MIFFRTDSALVEKSLEIVDKVAIETDFYCIPSIQESEEGGGALIREGRRGGGNLFDIMA